MVCYINQSFTINFYISTMVEPARKYKVNYSHLRNESSSTFSTVRVDKLADLVGEKSALNKLGDHLSHSL